MQKISMFEIASAIFPDKSPGSVVNFLLADKEFAVLSRQLLGFYFNREINAENFEKELIEGSNEFVASDFAYKKLAGLSDPGKSILFFKLALRQISNIADAVKHEDNEVKRYLDQVSADKIPVADLEKLTGKDWLDLAQKCQGTPCGGETFVAKFSSYVFSSFVSLKMEESDKRAVSSLKTLLTKMVSGKNGDFVIEMAFDSKENIIEMARIPEMVSLCRDDSQAAVWNTFLPKRLNEQDKKEIFSAIYAEADTDDCFACLEELSAGDVDIQCKSIIARALVQDDLSGEQIKKLGGYGRDLQSIFEQAEDYGLEISDISANVIAKTCDNDQWLLWLLQETNNDARNILVKKLLANRTVNQAQKDHKLVALCVKDAMRSDAIGSHPVKSYSWLSRINLLETIKIIPVTSYKHRQAIICAIFIYSPHEIADITEQFYKDYSQEILAALKMDSVVAAMQPHIALKLYHIESLRSHIKASSSIMQKMPCVKMSILHNCSIMDMIEDCDDPDVTELNTAVFVNGNPAPPTNVKQNLIVALLSNASRLNALEEKSLNKIIAFLNLSCLAIVIKKLDDYFASVCRILDSACNIKKISQGNLATLLPSGNIAEYCRQSTGKFKIALSKLILKGFEHNCKHISEKYNLALRVPEALGTVSYISYKSYMDALSVVDRTIVLQSTVNAIDLGKDAHKGASIMLARYVLNINKPKSLSSRASFSAVSGAKSLLTNSRRASSVLLGVYRGQGLFSEHDVHDGDILENMHFVKVVMHNMDFLKESIDWLNFGESMTLRDIQSDQRYKLTISHNGARNKCVVELEATRGCANGLVF